jgi:hypothetical protein
MRNSGNTKTSPAVYLPDEWEAPNVPEIESLDCFVPRNDSIKGEAKCP